MQIRLQLVKEVIVHFTEQNEIQIPRDSLVEEIQSRNKGPPFTLTEIEEFLQALEADNAISMVDEENIYI